MPNRNRVLRSLSQLQYDALAPSLLQVHLPAGATVYDPGEPVEAVYFPIEAVLSVVTLMGDGRSVEVATVGNESVVGIIPALAHVTVHARTFTQIAGAAIKLPASRLREVAAASPALLALLLAHVQQTLAQAEQSVACNAIHSARERIAKWLLLSQDRVGSREIPLTQEYLAIMLGVQRTTVTGLAQELRAGGIINYRRRGIEVTDRAALERASCECYGAIRNAEIDTRLLAV